jgi:hypothetical protein
MSSFDLFRKFCTALVLAMMAMSMAVRMLYGLSAWVLCRNSKRKGQAILCTSRSVTNRACSRITARHDFNS